MNYLYFAGGPLGGTRATQSVPPPDTLTAQGATYRRVKSMPWDLSIRIHCYEVVA